jgi:quinol monooxygenase YgiN
MICKTARYQVRPETVADVLGYNREFVAAVAENEAGTIRYESLQARDDPTRFLNTMVFADAAAETHHRATAHVVRYVECLYPCCVEPPAFIDYERVASTEAMA